MENKKTKLSISGSPKKSFKNFESSKTKGKKTVVIDKQQGRSFNKGGLINQLDQILNVILHLKLIFRLKPSQ